MPTREFLPRIENMAQVTDFVEQTLEQGGASPRVIMAMNVAVDELFSNIAYYSGAKTARITCGIEKGCAELRFCDDGKPYDPTSVADPDVTLSAEERTTGGLGIYMVKKSMDSICYSNENGWNILTICKKLTPQQKGK